MAEENFREAFSLFPACQKLLPHLYPSIRGDLQGDLRRICILFTKFESPDIRLNGSEKTLLTYIQKYRGLRGCWMEGFTACLQMRLVQNMYTLTYIHKNGSLVPLFWKMFTDCLQMPSLNSHRKMKTAPPSKKYLSPIRTKK